MAQPSAGENQGMHLPLHKYTEVLLTFIEGDPDRPVIAGAVPNPESASPITTANQTKSVISTGKGPETRSVGAEYARDAITTPNADNYIEFEDSSQNRRIRIQSKGNIWHEANERYGDYHVGQPDDTPKRATKSDVPKIGDMLAKFGTGNDYNPTGLLSRHGTTPSGYNFQKAFEEGHVHVSSFDTINTQEGNVYDFGGYWVYNLGNCYIENHVAQKTTTAEPRLAKLNEVLDDDLLGQGGPGWTTWKAIRATQQGGSKNELRETADPKWNQKHASSNNWQNIWVEKKFGDAYEYREGNTVSVTKGSTQEIKVSARSIEEKYSGDIKTYYMKSGGGEKWETKWDRHTGKMLYDGYSINKDIGAVGAPISNLTSTEKKYNRNTGSQVSESVTTDSGSSIKSVVTKYDRNLPYKSPVSYSDTTDYGHQVSSFKFTMLNKSYADISINPEEYFKFTLGNKAHADISISGEQYLTVKAAGVIGVSFSSGLVGNFKFPFVVIGGPGLTPLPLTSFDLDLSSFKLGLDLSGFSAKMMGLDLKTKKTSAEIVKEGLLKIVKAGEFSLERGGIKLCGNTIEITAI
jgi:hypothetical protein